MTKNLNNYLLNKKGMTLVELLTAMTILTLLIFCFAPLMLSYMETINIAGNKMERIYKDAGNLEVLLGKNSLDGNYTVSIDTVPIKLTSPDATVTVDGNTQNVATATIDSFVKAYGLTSGGTFSKDKDGNESDDGSVNISTGQATFYTDKAGSASGITLFPSSLTDDFKVAYITIYSADINFVLSQCEFVTTGPDGEIPLDNKVDYDLEYHPDRKNSTDTNILLLTVYGGGDKISFETSPLVFKHMGQRYEIQIDAPSMIMVGEKANDGKYYYYVSRGELEKDGGKDYLLIHRREMNSSDPTLGDVTLTSAMNDVEWVSSREADKYAYIDANKNGKKDDNEESYGYYIMGGDNGQIRRFWRNQDTGNYYWGGDHTYYTDIRLDRVSDAGEYYNATDRYSLGTSYKFFIKRNIDSNENVNGYKLVSHNENNLSCLNMYTVNAINSSARFYGSDGKIFSYKRPSDTYAEADDITNSGILWPNDGTVSYASMSAIQESAKKEGQSANINGVTMTDFFRIVRYNDTNEDYNWLKLDSNAYYNAMGINTSDKDGYPITITSVGSIVIQNYVEPTTLPKEPTSTTKANVQSGFINGAIAWITGDNYTVNTGNYEKNPLYVNHDAKPYGDGNATTNADYPTETYMLYCGYIPGAMDIWQNTTLANENWAPGMIENNGNGGNMATWDGLWAPITTYNVTRWDSSMHTAETERNPLWKGNLGIIPYLTTEVSGVKSETVANGNGLKVRTNAQGTFWGWLGSKTHWLHKDYRMGYMVQYPYTNLNYTVTGKYYDITTPEGTLGTLPNVKLMRNLAYNDAIIASEANENVAATAQTYQTNGRVVDITFSYLSHPFALHIAANPSDDISYSMANDCGQPILYWNNRRETTTILDAASAWVPSGEDDIHVSLAVGYTMGGLAQFSNSKKSDAYVNTIMNNGIVFIRAGSAIIGKQMKGHSATSEYLAKDNDGYQLAKESNYFHQFYYLNSRTLDSAEDSHIYDLYGAKGWQTNRHIDFVSMDGGQPGTGYNYLRCHPMSNTKVTCAVWGTSWASNPVAMWGTERGDLLSWVCQKVADGKGLSVTEDEEASNHNDRSVCAEFQSYKWIDNINKKTFNVCEGKYSGTVGSQGETWSAGTTNANYIGFYDSCSAAAAKQYPDLNVVANVGFISTLENINDVEYSDDIWIACGDQSNKDPADYCGTGNFAIGNASAGTDFVTRPYISSGNYGKTSNNKSDGRGGSWINVNYWIDCEGTGKQSSDNRLYQWSAVQISTEENCNIVQINNANGMWIATGYIDGSGRAGKLNDEYDEGEEACIFWTYDPRIPCGVEGGWSSHVRMYDGTTLIDEDDGSASKKLDTMGGINSCATRD